MEEKSQFPFFIAGELSQSQSQIISHGTYLQMNIDIAMHIYQSKPAQILYSMPFDCFNILRSLEYQLFCMHGGAMEPVIV